MEDEAEDGFKEILSDYETTNTLGLLEELVDLDRLRLKGKITEKGQEDRKKIIQILVAERLDVTQKGHVEYLIDSLHALIQIQQKQINEIIKFKEHRHKTIGGLYTEKAVY